MRWKFWRLTAIIMPFVLVLVTTSGQSMLTYDTVISAEISDANPQSFFTFNGSVGDIVSVYAIGHAQNFRPTILLSGITGLLGYNDGDPFTLLTNDAQVTYRLPSTGIYTIMIGNAFALPGMYTLALQKMPPSVGTVLGGDLVINFPMGAPKQVFSIAADPSLYKVINLYSASPDFKFNAWLRDPNAQLMMIGIGIGDKIEMSIPPGAGNYELNIASFDSSISGNLAVNSKLETPLKRNPVGSQINILPTPTLVPFNGTTTPTAQPVIVTTPFVCTATTPGQVNVRNGPSTEYDIINALLADGQFIAVGQNSGWFYGSINGASGWVSSSVVTISGPCSGLAFITAPLLPTTAATTAAAPATAIPVASSTPEIVIVTATPSPGVPIITTLWLPTLWLSTIEPIITIIPLPGP